MAQYSHLAIYNTAFVLLRELYERVPKFGKQYKYFLGGEMIQANIGVIKLILETNSTRDLNKRRDLLGELIWKSESIIILLWLCKKIIFHDPTSDYVYKGDFALRRLIPNSKSLFNSKGNGLPIGNLTSQFFANVYLNELDQYVTKVLGCIRYLRYVDDFVIIGTDKDKLISYIKKVNLFLISHLMIHLHPNKIYLQKASHGIDFLGYFIKPTHMLVRRSVVNRFKRKLCQNIDPETGFLDICFIPVIQSYLGHFGHANGYNLACVLCPNLRQLMATGASSK